MDVSYPEFRIWQHLENTWNGTQLHHLVNIPSIPIDQLYNHMVSSNGPIIPFTSNNESIDDAASLWTLFSHTEIYVMAIGCSIPLDTIFSYWNLCNGYRIIHTWKIRDILLLLYLVPTCQISLLTFTLRFYMTYYCGWWCRGSTHLQMQWQAWTAYDKASWKSWPVYEMGTYTDGDLTEATNSVKSSFCVQIIG